MWLLALILSVPLSSANEIAAKDNPGNKKVVCYYTNWSVYRPGTAKFSPQNINPYLCTHLIYAFGGLTRENGLRPYDKYQDIEQGGYAKFNGLKTYNKNLKTLLAIGGWNEGSARFSPLVADEDRREEFVKNVIRFLRQYQFDGLDLDWEYPAFRDGGKAYDKENYVSLVQELREEFDRESRKTGRPRLLLTMAVPAGIEYIDKGYDVPKLNRYLDFLNILSYDYHSAFEPTVNHHSPLYSLVEDSEYNFDAQLNIDYTVNYYIKKGADRDKLVVGIPTYGRSYTLFNPIATDIGSPADGPGEQGDATREKGYLAYYEICESVSKGNWKVIKPNAEAVGPYAYKGNQWVGYDDEEIVRHKARYVRENNLGGIMFWSIDNDDFRGKCHSKPYPLIEAGKQALFAESRSSSGIEKSSPESGRPFKSKGRRRNNVDTNSVRKSSSGSRSRPRSRRPGGKRNRSPSTTTTTTTTTTPRPAYDPLSTPEPPTTPDPGSDFTCKDEGFFPHPRDCKKYFWCLDSGPSNLGIVAHQFTCPSGLFFNKAADSCDYSRNVLCNVKKNKGTTTTTTTTTPRSTSRTTTRRTTTTTTTTSAPEYDDEDYDEEYDEEEEDPADIKELLNLIKKLGGVEELEKQLQIQDSGEGDSKKSSIPTPPSNLISRSLYDRVLNRNKGALEPTTSAPKTSSSRYTSLYRNRPARPQNEGLEELEEVAPLRREKPQYVTIRRDRPKHQEEDEDDVEEEERNASDAHTDKAPSLEYVTIRRQRPEEPESTTPKYVTIQRSRQTTTERVQDDEEEVPAIVREIPPLVRPGPRRERVRPQDSPAEDPSERGKVEEDEKRSQVGFRRRFRPSYFQDATTRSPRPTRGPNYRRRGGRGTTTTTTTTEEPSRASTLTSTVSTITQVITSVTESGTEKQRIAVTRLPVDLLEEDGYIPRSRQDHKRPSNRSRHRSPLLTNEDLDVSSRAIGDETAGSIQRTTAERFLEKPRKTEDVDLSVRTSTQRTDYDLKTNEISLTEAPATSSVPETRGPVEETSTSSHSTTTDYSSPEPTTTTTIATTTTTTTSRPKTILRRPSGAVHTRSRGRSSTPRPTRTPEVSSTPASGNRKQSSRVNIPSRRRTYRPTSRGSISFRSNSSADLTTTEAPPTVSPTKFSFPRRRIPTLPRASALIQDVPTLDENDEASIVHETSRLRTSERETDESGESSSYQDLANVAVVAIHNLGTAPPSTTIPPITTQLPLSLSDETPRTVSPSKLHIEPSTTSPLPRRATIVKITRPTQPSFQLLDEPTSKPIARRIEPRPRVTTPRPKKTTTRAPPLLDYEYYDSYEDEPNYFDIIPLSNKVKIHTDGYIECFDRGNFPHPYSCKKFISCAKMENGEIVGWEYTCPRQLVFDPIGGMCNWSGGLGCKE